MSQAVYTVQREPDPSHIPEKGDRYLSRTFGIAVSVIAVGEKDGARWVVWETDSGVRYKTELTKFASESRRMIKKRGRR